MSRFAAVKTKSFLDTFLLLLGGEFADFDNVDVYGTRVSGFGRGREGLVGLVGGF